MKDKIEESSQKVEKKRQIENKEYQTLRPNIPITGNPQGGEMEESVIKEIFQNSFPDSTGGHEFSYWKAY